ncbi:hypothetical protein C8R44DRAFT_622541, partial [Mycena epipterygia]
CTNCHKIDSDLKLSQCGKARCKEAWYCSKECQKKHWRVSTPPLHSGTPLPFIYRPTHKLFCRNVEGSGIRKLLYNFIGNKLLDFYLQACIILLFDLLDRPPLDPPFRARVDIGIEPADVLDFLDIFVGNPPRTGEIKGMLQVNAITRMESVAPARLSPERAHTWRIARESSNPGDCLGLIEFGNGKSVQSIVCPILIQPPAMDLVRSAAPWGRRSAVTGEVTDVSFNFDSCLETLNIHNRADKKDQLRLRTTMRPSDIQTIHDASAKLPATNSARVLRAKIAREDIYALVTESGGVVTRLPLVDMTGQGPFQSSRSIV